MMYLMSWDCKKFRNVRFKVTNKKQRLELKTGHPTNDLVSYLKDSDFISTWSQNVLIIHLYM